jgi:DNA polymerase family A
MIEPRITYAFERKLQAIYNEIANRGVRIDVQRLGEAKAFVEREITRNLAIASNQWNIKLFTGVENDPNKGKKKGDPTIIDAQNLGSTSGEKSFLNLLKNLGYTVPKIAKRNTDGEYESNYSTGELSLQRMLRDNQFGYPTGDPALKAILAVRELSKLKTSYLNAHFYRDTQGNLFFLSLYNAAGTLTGRRASRKHTYGFGNNGQNHPKHSRIAEQWRRCLVARPGNIFLMVDQKSAEEWPVSALANNQLAIEQMLKGINRHIWRATYIFNIAEGSRTKTEWKDSMEYYLGKKSGHANNYNMQPPRMSESLIQEGFYVSVDACTGMLNRLNTLEPNIRGVFHKYVRDTISSTRILKTPFGRERQFLGLRPNDANNKVFNEAFAFIPQSSIGDNTGFAVAHIDSSNLDTNAKFIVQEGHDSIVQDLPDNLTVLDLALQNCIQSFNRQMRFENGIVVQVPIEAEIGYDFATTVTVDDLSYDGLKIAKQKLMEKVNSQKVA